MDERSTHIARLLRRNRTMDFAAIVKNAGQRSRRSLFRDLCSLGYLTSFTHAGRYYTLTDTPQFDEHGLWFYRGIGFSRAGTLRSTLIELIEASVAGYTHHELQALLHVRVHNTLLGLVRDKHIGRGQLGKLYVYVNTLVERAEEQLANRRQWLETAPVTEPALLTIVEVLVEVIKAGPILIGPTEVVKRLRGRGIGVTVSEVEQVFSRYGLVLKKTLR